MPVIPGEPLDQLRVRLALVAVALRPLGAAGVVKSIAPPARSLSELPSPSVGAVMSSGEVRGPLVDLVIELQPETPPLFLART